MEIPVDIASIVSLSPELTFGKRKESKGRHASQPRGTVLSNQGFAERTFLRNEENSPARPDLKEVFGLRGKGV